LVPLLTTTLLLIPTYLRLYAYQKGTCECCWLLMCVFRVHNARVQTTHVFYFGGSSIFSVVFVSILANHGGCKCLLHNVLLQLFGNVLFAMFCSQCSVRNVLFAIVSTLDSSHGHHWVLQTQNRGGGSWCPLVQVLHGRRRSGRARWPWVRG
jgi:hypothetical protein